MRVGYGGSACMVQGRPVPGWKTHMVHDASGEFTRAGGDAGASLREIRRFCAGASQ